MEHNTVIRLATAVAKDELPIRLGDLILFMISGNNMLVISCSEQAQLNDSMAQEIAGILSCRRGSRWEHLDIAWDGYGSLWSIQRL